MNHLAHKRSPEKMKERATKRKIKAELKNFILTTSFRDMKIGETVCTLTREQIDFHGRVTFGAEFDRHEESLMFPFYEAVRDGTVLSDSYGKGAFQ